MVKFFPALAHTHTSDDGDALGSKVQRAPLNREQSSACFEMHSSHIKIKKCSDLAAHFDGGFEHLRPVRDVAGVADGAAALGAHLPRRLLAARRVHVPQRQPPAQARHLQRQFAPNSVTSTRYLYVQHFNL
jgi:hypothetical protein